jgi:A/G-specific adenine glycosylase
VSAPTAEGRARLHRQLLGWYDRQRRNLPWRRSRDPYAIWLSEVMLQQTQVSVVLPYWESFLRRFPDVRALAEAPLDAVLAAWRGLGYYARARNLHQAAQAIVRDHGGRFPRTVESLGALPGFGRYTVGAVASIAFGLPVPLVDGNVARVLARLFAIEGAAGDTAREKVLWRLAEALVEGERPGDWNQALMELGATVCRPESPSCLLCPLREECRALAMGAVDRIPAPRPRAARRAMRLAVAVVRRGSSVLLVRREGTGLFGGLWELPAVEVAGAGDMRAALESAWDGVEVAERPLATVERTLTHRDLRLTAFEVARLRAPPGGRYVTRAEAEALGVSAAMQAVLEQVFGAAPTRRPRRKR